MIPKSRKFPLRTKFLDFRRHAHRLSSLHTICYILPTLSHSRSEKPVFALRECNSRLSVIVPKKTSPLATARSWLRRLSYDTLWPLISDKNLDVVLVYKPIKLTKSRDLKSHIISELNQLTL